ncbi:hypothetical protein RB195_023667 [Necator americanus]|uniref:UBA domain-containing protein n=1 Tax=Necator americanus TaxID=51031 RepID=A0ABR1EMD1_NECAM
MGQPTCGNEALPPRLRHRASLGISERDDVLEVLDPLSAVSLRKHPLSSVSTVPLDQNFMARMEQMEILYLEAPFADRSRCDQMVAKCRGDIASALRELKVKHLIDTRIADDREKARKALESSSWDLNAAAEFLLMTASSKK